MRYIRRIGTSTVLTLVVAWAAWIFIAYYVSATAKDLTPFDPFEILGVCPSKLLCPVPCMVHSVWLQADALGLPARHMVHAEAGTSANAD